MSQPANTAEEESPAVPVTRSPILTRNRTGTPARAPDNPARFRNVILTVKCANGRPLQEHLYRADVINAVVQQRTGKVPTDILELGAGGAMLTFRSQASALAARNDLSRATEWMGCNVTVEALGVNDGDARDYRQSTHHPIAQTPRTPRRNQRGENAQRARSEPRAEEPNTPRRSNTGRPQATCVDYQDDRTYTPNNAGPTQDQDNLARAWNQRFPFGLYNFPPMQPDLTRPPPASNQGHWVMGPNGFFQLPSDYQPPQATSGSQHHPRAGDLSASTSRAALADATLERSQVQKGPARVKRQRQFGKSTAKPATKIDTFTGGKDGTSYVDWLFRVESLIPCFQEAMVRQVILGSVGGYAAQLLRALGQDASVDLLLDRLDEAFGEVQSCHALVKALYSVTQREDENVNEFMARIGAAVHAVQDNYPDYWSPTVAAMHEREGFFHGLRPGMRTELRAEYNSGGSYLELVRAARVVEGEKRARDPYRRDRPAFRATSKSASVAPHDHESDEEPREAVGAKAAAIDRRNSRQDKPRRTESSGARDRSQSRSARNRQLIQDHQECCQGRVCFYCHGCDHFAGECPKRRRDEEEGTRKPGNDNAGKGIGGPSPSAPHTA